MTPSTPVLLDAVKTNGTSPPTWRKCGHPRTPENTCGVRVTLPGGRCRICQRTSDVRYSHSEKGRASRARHARTSKRRVTDARYRRTERARAKNARYDVSEKGRTKRTEYARTEKGLKSRAQAKWKYQGIIDLTWAQFQAAVKKQRGRCAICCERPTDVCRRWRLDADHDHATGRFRGALCPSCNVRLAKYERGVRFHNRKLNARMREYLKRENVHQLSLALVAR